MSRTNRRRGRYRGRSGRGDRASRRVVHGQPRPRFGSEKVLQQPEEPSGLLVQTRYDQSDRQKKCRYLAWPGRPFCKLWSFRQNFPEAFWTCNNQAGATTLRASGVDLLGVLLLVHARTAINHLRFLPWDLRLFRPRNHRCGVHVRLLPAPVQRRDVRARPRFQKSQARRLPQPPTGAGKGVTAAPLRGLSLSDAALGAMYVRAVLAMSTTKQVQAGRQVLTRGLAVDSFRQTQAHLTPFPRTWNRVASRLN